MDDRNEYAHWALGISCWSLLKYDESQAALERAVALNPNCSLAYGSLGTLLAILGRPEEAIANQDIAIRSNPLDPSIFFRFSGLALAHYMAGRYETAVKWAGRAIHRRPTWYFAHFILAASHVAQGHEQEAVSAVNAALDALPELRVKVVDRVPLEDAEHMRRLRARLIEAGFPQ